MTQLNNLFHDGAPSSRSRSRGLFGHAACASLVLSALLLAAAPNAALAAEAIASADGDVPGQRVEIRELTRDSDGTLTLKFTMINGGDGKLAFGNDFGAHGMRDHGTVGGVHLVDAANKKKYLVVRDSKKTCLCSRGLKSVKPQASLNLWAMFPAPPEDVEKVTVIVPHFMPLKGVPISK